MTLLLLFALVLIQTASSAQTGEPVYPPGNGVTLPQLIKEVKPAYTSEAMRARISGTVLLEGIVRTDGTVSDIRVIRSLDSSLDREAVNAFRQWRFSPGTRNGEPVAVRITNQMSFVLRDAPPASVPPLGRVVVLSRANRDGTRTVFDIPKEQADKQPQWRASDSPSPPLPLGDAVKLALEWIGKSKPEFRDNVLMGASLGRFGGYHWFYTIDFGPVSDNLVASERLTVVVLLDGTVVEPRIVQP